MWIDTITREDVIGRSRVDQLAATNPEAALDIARKIRHLRYRCQALSTVAEHIERNRMLEVLVEAISAAKEQNEINRVVTVSAWPMKQLIHIQPELATNEIVYLVKLANSEPHALRRADALFSLAKSVSQSQIHLALIIPSLVASLLGGRGWRIDRLIRFSIDDVKRTHPEEIPALIAHHGEKRKKQLLSYVNESQI